MHRIPWSLLVSVALCVGASAVASAGTTTVKAKTSCPVAPLTGRADCAGVTRHHSAITVKVDNTPLAHPQYGLDQADVVYEEIVEGGITRLAAIFDSHVPVRVGPVRSVRRTDREIVYPIGGIFAFSGGAPYALASIETAPVQLYDEANSGSAMYRDPARYPPHNLFVDPTRLIVMSGRVHLPRPLFSYVGASQPGVGVRVGSFVVNFPAGYAVTYQWNKTFHDWVRSIFAKPDFTATHVRISPVNVIVMTVNYLGGVGQLGAQAQLLGLGSVEVFSDGRVQKGRWYRPVLRDPTVYRTSSGRVIDLRPGQTWLELIARGESVSVYSRRSARG